LDGPKKKTNLGVGEILTSHPYQRELEKGFEEDTGGRSGAGFYNSAIYSGEGV